MKTACLNGQPRTFSPEVATLHDLIRSFGLHARRIAVEINGTLVDPTRFTTTALQDGDRIEIVSFVGGG